MRIQSMSKVYCFYSPYDLLHYILSCMLVLLLWAPSFGQIGALQTEYYSINDGLSDRVVTHILQNTQGLLWIATPNGLNKFDGYEFTVYDDHPENPNKINAVDIEWIGEDKSGNIILVYRNNFFFFDILNPSTNEVKKISLATGNGIRGIARDLKLNRDGELQILTNHKDTLKLYNFIDQGQFQLVFQYYQEHTRKTAPIDILQLNTGNVLINDSEIGLSLVEPDGHRLKTFQSYDFECMEHFHPYPGSTHLLHQDQKGRIWASFPQISGVYLYNEAIDFFELYPNLPDGYYTSIWEDETGNVLFPRTTGIGYWPEVLELFCIKDNGDIVNFSYLLDLSSRIIFAFSKDFFQTVFLGIDTGVKIIQNNRQKVKTYLAQNLKLGQRGAVMRGISSDGKGRIFFARDMNNWYVLDTLTDNLDTIYLKDPVNGDTIDFRCCMDIHYEEGYLWGISCRNSTEALLIKYDLELEETQFYTYENQLTSLIKGHDGRYWMGYTTSSKEGGLVSFDPKTETWEEYKEAKHQNPLKDATPFYLYEEDQANLWVGSDNGLYQINRDSGTHEVLQMRTATEPNGLLSNTIFVIHQDTKGGFWLGTSNGLNYYHPKTGAIESYGMRLGLANNKIYGIIEDEFNNLWISSYNGISYFDTHSKLSRNYYKTDGLSEDEFNQFSFYRATTGRYYFGSTNGINAFYPENLLSADNNPPLVLTKFTRFNSQLDSLIVQTSNLDNIKELTISPYDTYFQLNFSLPNYIQSRKNQFASQLKGYEKNWTYLGNTPQIRYNNLPAGSYTLKLRGADPNGNWHTEALSVKIRVQPIWYKTKGAIIAVLLIIALILYGIFQYQLEQRLKVERLRTKISSDLHDEVSGLLSGIAMQTDVLKSIIKDEKSKTRLKTIGEVSRTAMTKMSDVIWSIDSRKDRVEDLIHRMQEHSEDILYPMNVRYWFKIGKIDQQQKIPVHIRQNLYFIFKEAINNIAKHSNATKVQIFFGNNGSTFELMVKDNGNNNGNGISNHKPSKKQGQGMSNLKMRAQRINARLDIANHDGYTVRLTMKKFAKP